MFTYSIRAQWLREEVRRIIYTINFLEVDLSRYVFFRNHSQFVSMCLTTHKPLRRIVPNAAGASATTLAGHCNLEALSIDTSPRVSDAAFRHI